MPNAIDMWTVEWSMSLFVIKQGYNSFARYFWRVVVFGRRAATYKATMNWTSAQFVPLPVEWRHWYIQKNLQCPIYYKYGPLSKPTHSGHRDTPNNNTSEKSRGDVRTNSREPKPKFPNQIKG